MYSLVQPLFAFVQPRVSALALLFISAFSAAPSLAQANTLPPGAYWKITKTSWSQADEDNYSTFINRLGRSGCNTISNCMTSPANPYLSDLDSQVAVALGGDCGKLAYMLRGYFAWKNGLPFSYVSEVDSSDGAPRDIRYSPNGNVVSRRYDIIQNRAGSSIVAVRALHLMVADVFTAMYRFSPTNDIDYGGLFFDFVPVKVDRTSVRPGTMIYDPNGHVAIVYEVEADGRVLFMDAHPDESVTHGTYGEKFVRSSPGMGAGFKNFRPLFLTDATQAPDGSYYGGKITTIPFTQIPDYSLEQFFGTDPNPTQNWRSAVFSFNGKVLGYYDFVRNRLATGVLRYQPVNELANMMIALCTDIKSRLASVETAVQAKIQLQPEPINLPADIFGAAGDWETYATPSRDARLKASFLEVITNIQKYVNMYRQGSSSISYTGTNLGADLRQVYNSLSNSCVIQYTKSDGAKASLNYHDVESRLFALSFDPYQCPERRWGASGVEFAGCTDDALKAQWYSAEQIYRNIIEAPTTTVDDSRPGYTLPELQQFVQSRGGPGHAPNVDLLSYLNTL